jgi:DNA-binding CsgD family transcriptional regulator
VAFAARRLSGPVGLLATARTDPDSDHASWLQLPRPDAMQRVNVPPLSLGDLRPKPVLRPGIGADDGRCGTSEIRSPWRRLGARRIACRRKDLPLTKREREVISLVAQGLSNRQIADALTLSIRSVEGHLCRASVRSDATTRAELGALIREFDAK